MKKAFHTFSALAKRHGFLLLIACSAAIGVFLRLYQITTQIIGGDEWNGLRIAARTTWGHIFTNYHAADNCIPLTAYYKFLYDTAGLSELGLHSLPLVAGILMLPLFPWLVKSIHPAGAAAVFAFLLSLSPFLIFYSRYGRPYILVALLGFTAILSFYLWLEKRKILFAGLYIFCAVLAPYFNLFSLAAVSAPLVFSLLSLKAPRLFPFPSGPPRAVHVLFMGFPVMLGIAMWFLPTLGSLDLIAGKAGRESVTIDTILKLPGLYGGTGRPWLWPFLLILFLWGVYSTYRKNRFLSGLLIFCMIAQGSAIALARPLRCESPVIFGRYFIPCLPLGLLFIAAAVHSVTAGIDRLAGPSVYGRPPRILPGLFILFLFLVGPLPAIYRYPNNFTNHGDFQYDYGNPAVKIPKRPAELYPAFYTELRKEPLDTGIIETPSLRMWALQNYHLYQIWHEKRVWIGHDGLSYTCHPRFALDDGIHLENMVNIQDPKAVASTGAGYVVVHKDILNECIHLRKNYPRFEYYLDRLQSVDGRLEIDRGDAARQAAAGAIRHCRRFYGEPCHEDEWITVFKVR